MVKRTNLADCDSLYVVIKFICSTCLFSWMFLQRKYNLFHKYSRDLFLSFSEKHILIWREMHDHSFKHRRLSLMKKSTLLLRLALTISMFCLRINYGCISLPPQDSFISPLGNSASTITAVNPIKRVAMNESDILVRARDQSNRTSITPPAEMTETTVPPKMTFSKWRVDKKVRDEFGRKMNNRNASS